MMNRRYLIIGLLALFGGMQADAQNRTAGPGPSIAVKEGRLTYLPDAKGNRVLDFSYCGYHASEDTLPLAPVKVFVPWKAGDNTHRIQKALDYVASLSPSPTGCRGAVLLDKGVFEVCGRLHISASGVVLRGSGRRETTLVKKGTARESFIRIEGADDFVPGDSAVLLTPYLPLNERTLLVDRPGVYRRGDRVRVIRPSAREWIASLGCDTYGGGINALGWKPGDIDLCWDRTVVAVEGDRITLDAPLTMALCRNEGVCTVVGYVWNGRLQECGIEALTLESDYDRNYPKDEDHCWTAISVERAENCWVRQVDFRHFAGSAVILQPTASKVTVEDCKSLAPVSELGGMRRTTFFTLGQQNLFQRCYSEQGIHDFAAGFCAAGPNAFVQCEAGEALGFSGSVGSWACGLLFDVVDIEGHNLSCMNLGQDYNGAGWNAANSLIWQCTAAEIECYAPSPETQNRAFGCWAQFSGNGEWVRSNNHIQPRSIFYAQLAERVGRPCAAQARMLERNTTSTSSPTVELAMQLAQEAFQPRLTLAHWIDEARMPIVAVAGKVKEVDALPETKVTEKRPASEEYVLENGRLMRNGRLLVGGKYDTPWWNGNLRNSYLKKAKPALTRFVPNREGLGLTDRVDSVITYMKRNGLLAFDQNYGLWYDRRRDDHERVRRRDGNVWGPFYEQPFSRSGEGKAWEGLSLYDLKRPNAWYWGRLREFADKAAHEGLLLYHEHYFQHNILEAGAHWVDSPWRAANNINGTDFPEPVPFAGDKRIFMAEYFYDETHPVRRELHRNYIRQCLEAFADCPNVVQLISAEYTGPLHFVRFWLDTIEEWEAETGKQVLVALAVTKDVQDAILADERRSKVVDIIDIRYWHYKTDGIFNPEGGKNLAPRQHMRKMKVGKIGFDEAYKAVSEYRSRYPEKAVTYYAQNYSELGWAVLMAGGSCPSVRVDDPRLLEDLREMEPVTILGSTTDKMVKSGKEYIIFYHSGKDLILPVEVGKYTLYQVDTKTGKVSSINKSLKVKDRLDWKAADHPEGVYWLRR